ncbi:superoxide dismutase [Spiroplasma endosymbiont of Agriotes lineatus]|uniref:superoxide dismutase n=1 Tax=Spiroplasma endosymbiont of Agriotes lineatus TaxID=3077930 RepID=UPI0030D5E442
MFQRKELNYSLDALEPIISKETMDYHYNKHHKAYEDGLNNTLAKLENNNKPTDLNQLMRDYLTLPNEYHVGIRQFGGGLINHNFFFSILAKDKPISNGKLKTLIEETYGSMEKWQEKMCDAALQVFGSGWTWLLIDRNGKLKIFNTFNQDNPWFLKSCPLIGIDVWEHAYYIDYRNDRKTYVTKFFDIINWEEVEKLYDTYLKNNSK